jgi:hypothetical protein
MARNRFSNANYNHNRLGRGRIDYGQHGKHSGDLNTISYRNCRIERVCIIDCDLKSGERGIIIKGMDCGTCCRSGGCLRLDRIPCHMVQSTKNAPAEVFAKSSEPHVRTSGLPA